MRLSLAPQICSANWLERLLEPSDFHSNIRRALAKKIRNGKTERQKDRVTERQKHRKTETQKDRKDRSTEIQKCTEIYRKTERQKMTE
jgi:hypothetical protein